MGKFERLCELLPAEVNWGDPITPQMVEEIIAAEREDCAKVVVKMADSYGSYPDRASCTEIANAIRKRSNV